MYSLLHFLRTRFPILRRIGATSLLVALTAATAFAQTAVAPDASAVTPQSLSAMTPKTFVLVFDVSGSMNDKGYLRRARQETVDLLREGVAPGDHVALLTFGAGTKTIFDTTVGARSEIAGLIDQIPTHTDEGAGTNIREPHHRALKMVDAGLPNPGVIVLLTDSFNDEPKSADAAYPNYLRYYTPGGMLTKYPQTPENRDYERLLKKLLASGKLTQMGVGIKIADTGRPIERLPQAATPAPAPTDEASASDSSNTPVRSVKPSPLPWIALLGGGTVIAVLWFVVTPFFRGAKLRVSGATSSPKDFQIDQGKAVKIGGDGAGAAFDAYPIPGAREPVATIRNGRGQLFVAPVSPTGNQTAPPRVYHNGLPLEKEEPLNYGDEVRVGLPQADTGALKEYRLKFEDPRKSF